jgi:hypothetical protein
MFCAGIGYYFYYLLESLEDLELHVFTAEYNVPHHHCSLILVLMHTSQRSNAAQVEECKGVPLNLEQHAVAAVSELLIVGGFQVTWNSVFLHIFPCNEK